MPKVSIIVPNYNHARYLRQRLETVIRQTFTDFELIILDDASTDNSREVIQEYLADPRVRFLPNEQNSGSPFAQWNRGVQLARGEYVWIAESDDYCTNQFLEEMVPILDRNSRVGVAYCQSWCVDAENQMQGSLHKWTADLDEKRWENDYINNGVHECRNYLIYKNTIPNASAVLFRKGIFLQAGSAPSNFRLCGDWLVWVKMLFVADIAFRSESYNFFRQHHKTVRESTRRDQRGCERWKVRRAIQRHCWMPRETRKKLAFEAMSELWYRLRTVPKVDRFRGTMKIFQLVWPFFLAAPLATLQDVFTRGRKHIRREIRPDLQ